MMGRRGRGPSAPLDERGVYERLARRCALAEVCPGDALAKCRSYGLDQAAAERVVTRLIDGGYIDAARYARAYTADKVRLDHQGPHKIRAALRAKGLDAALVEEALRGVTQEEWHDALAAALRAKARALARRDDDERRLKLMRHAAARGFDRDSAERAIDELN